MNTDSRVSFSSRCWGSILVASALLLPACGGGGRSGSGSVGPGPGGGGARTAETAVLLTADGRLVVGAPDDAGAAAVELSTPAMTRVRRFAVSPDGGAVAYVADCEQMDRFDLYVREIAGAAPLRVSVLTNTFNDVEDFAWAPDSQSIAYRADGIVDDRAELFRVGRDGNGHYRVFQSGIANIFVTDEYGWSPDSRHLFCALQQTTTQFELRLHDASTNVEGAPSVLVVPPGREILDVTFSPDSQWIAMRADHLGQDEQFEVFRRRTDLSGATVRSNGNAGTIAKINQYAWSPDSRWLAQTVHSRTTNAKIGINTYEIATDASRRVFTSSFESMAWSPVANRLAVAANFDPTSSTAGGALQLLVHDVDANTLATVSDPFTGTETLRGDLFVWSPDGARIAYVGSVAFLDERAYLAEPGSALPVVPASDLGNLEVVQLLWSGDSQRLALLERNQTQAFHPGEWHVLGLDGRSVFRSGSFFTFATSLRMRWSSDSVRAVYAVAAAAAGPDRVRSVQADGKDDVGVSGLDVNSFEVASAALPKP